jgi:S-formylglutathione hydrolase FrmB/predicted ester cyclase
MFRFAGGKIVEEWIQYDLLGVVEQFGAMPPSRPTPENYMWGAPSEVSGDPGDPATNTAQVLYVVQKFWNEQKVAGLDNTHSLDSIAHNPVIPGHPLPYNMYKHVCLLHLAAFPDMRVTTENIIAEADKVAIHWTVNGTHLGPLMGIPPTGRPVTFTGMTIYRFADSKIVENWWSYDALGMMQQITGPLPVPEDLVVEQITSPSLEGNALGDPAMRNMVIYLPPGYEYSDKGYPVVYLIPGLGATERWWACGEFSPAFSLMGIAVQNLPEAGFASMIDELIADGKMQPMIIVMPDISTAYGGSFCVNSALNGNHEDYIVNDIVPYIDANYRTLPSRNSRGIAGHCMGGYAAMYLSMRHPDVFGAVVSHSGTLMTSGLLPDMQTILAAENPEGLTLTGPDPAKPWTSTLYLFSAAFSPNPDNPPFYVDFPFDENVQLREEVAQTWAAYDLLQIFPDHVSDLASLRGIYLDAGDKDEIGEQLIAQAFSEALSAAGIEHQIEIFDGAHMDNVYTRLAVSLSYLSNALGD